VDGLVAEADVALHDAASLRHSVNLGLLQVKAESAGGLTEYGRESQQPLAADAGEDDVALHSWPP
jgi:hypothetical protein